MLIRSTQWFNLSEEYQRSNIILRLLDKEREYQALSILIDSKSGKIPENLLNDYRRVLTRAINNAPILLTCDDKRINSFPKYDNSTHEIVGSLQSIMSLLRYCYPAQKRILKERNTDVRI